MGKQYAIALLDHKGYEIRSPKLVSEPSPEFEVLDANTEEFIRNYVVEKNDMRKIVARLYLDIFETVVKWMVGYNDVIRRGTISKRKNF